MKKAIVVAVVALLILGIFSVALAEIIPPEKEDWQIGPPAVVLCESLSLRKKPSFSSKARETLSYGDHIIVIEEKKGWAYVTLGDSEDSPKGWVNSDYIAINPAWYKTEKKTPVYAWDDKQAPRVALLEKKTYLPILTQEGDWILVSLLGAVGWIHK